jgi:hypothetical protein
VQIGDRLALECGILVVLEHDSARPAGEVPPEDVPVTTRLGRELAEQRIGQAVAGDQLPGGVEDRDRKIGQPVEHALDAGREVAGDPVGARRRMSCEPEEVIALVVLEPESPRERRDHLQGRVPRATLLEAREVVGREAREPGELLTTQTRCSAQGLARQTDRRGRETIAPRAKAIGEIVLEHASSIAPRASAKVAPSVLVSRDLWWSGNGGRTVPT